MSEQAAVLMAALLLAHCLGDFTPLATARMQDAKAVGSPIAPIGGHALIHAALVGLAVLIIVRPEMKIVGAAAAIEFWSHVGIDWMRGKLGAKYPSLSDPSRQAFWTALGIDQLLHGLVLVWIAWMVFWLVGVLGS